ncbi:MAG: carbohydrate ABC transporter permease [Halanaerobiales bacterium]|nr:carbohydrate ABC transporter permease [Halanaerobiales bacterium]
MNRRKINWAIVIFLVIGSIFILFPLYLTVTNAFKTPQEMAQSVLSLPKQLHFDNFIQAIKMTNFFRSFKNSFLITICAVAITLLTNSMIAYAIARNMDKKFFKILYYYFISALFIPFPIIMLPIVKQTSIMGMDNQWGLILLYVVYGLAFNIFVYVGYIKSIPISLEEAAIIDGCSIWKVFWKIIFPLMAPINATVGILTTLWVWNDFLLPLVILSNQEQMTLPLVQFVFQSQFSTDYHLAFASYLMVMTPLIIVYILAQKWVISGILRGSTK